MVSRILLVLSALLMALVHPGPTLAGAPTWLSPREAGLFDGRASTLWEKYSASGGNFDQFARYDGDALVIDVPKDAGWGKTGLVSKAPALWLDEFGEGASATITIEIDPNRTSLVAIALTPTKTSDDSWSLESVLAYWRLKPDGTGAMVDLYDHSRITEAEKHLDLPKAAPTRLSLVLTPGKAAIEVDGKPLLDLPFVMAQPGVGFFAYVHTGAIDANKPGGMALKSVRVERKPGTEPPAVAELAPGVAPLPVRRIFSGPLEGWDPFGIDGGDFAKSAKAGRDGVLISAPDKAGWARTGIVSKTRLFAMDAMAATAPRRLLLAFDPAKTTGAMIFISPAKSGWFYREVAASVAIHRLGPDRWRLAAYSGDPLVQSRDFAGPWDGRLTLDMGGHRAVFGVPGGPSLVVFNAYFEPPHPFHVSVLTRPQEVDKAAALLLKSIDLTRVPPPGMSQALRWRLLEDTDFDPALFLKELIDLPEDHSALPWTPRVIVTDARPFVATVGARLAQAEAQPAPDRPTGDALIRQIAERLHNLDREKLDALLTHLGTKAPDGFYGCLCSGRWHAGHVAVRYNGQTGACHFSGFGEWEEPLPNTADAWGGCTAEHRFADGRTIVEVIAGAVKDLRKKQPAVAEKPAGPAAPPPILVDPKACGRDDPHRAERIKAFTQLEMNHFPAAGLKALDVSLRKRITDLDQPGALPTWWESVGLASPPPADKADKERWCLAMLERYDALILPLLARGNPLEIASALRKYSAALGQFDKAMQEESEAAIDMIAADQKEVEAILSMVPLAGQALDLIAVANWLTGDKDLGLTGEAITTTDIVIRSLGYIAPAALAEAMSRSPTMHLIAAGLSEMGAAYGTAGKAALVKLLGGSESKVVANLKILAGIMTKERSLLISQGRSAAGNAIAKHGMTVAGEAERRLLETEGRNARTLLDRLKTLEPGSAEWEAAVREVRANKTAIRVANSSEYDDALRRRINQTTEGWTNRADAATSHDLRRLLTADDRNVAAIAGELGITKEAADRFRAETRALADKHGIEVGQLEIRAKSVTNRRPGQVGEKLPGDRDGTFEAFTPTGVAIDIDHTVSSNSYYNNFATAAGASRAEIAAAGGAVNWSHGRMDQTITSKGALDAYNHGAVELKDFLDKSRTPTIVKVEDVRDTITHKSTEWFERNRPGLSAAEINQNTVEGIRQATKQWEDIILSRAKTYGVDVEAIVPERLAVAISVFNRATEGRLTATQVEIGLAALTAKAGGKSLPYTKEAVVADMGAFFEMLEKGPGKVYRDIEGKKVAGMVQVLASAKSPGWQNGALSTLNDALKDGRISGDRFMQLRAEVMAETVKGMPPAEFANWLKSAYTQGLVNAAEVAAGAR